MNRILVVAPIYDMHTYRFISNLKHQYKELNIDVLGYEKRNENIACSEYCNKIFFPINSPFFNRTKNIKYISLIAESIDFRRTLASIYKKEGKYDAVILLWILPCNFLSARIYKKLSKKLILVPLGSDVLRTTNTVRHMLRHLYNQANYVILSPINFKNIAQKIFKINEEKIIPLDFGSTVIDKLQYSEITKYEAKKRLGLENNFIITIGYSANKAHNHLAVIKQIEKISTKLPENTVLLFPMTYPSGEEFSKYIIELKSYLNRAGLQYMFFTEYLDDEQIVLLRKSADIFIHAQTTDAGCATLQEYLLAGATIINADWLYYKELQQFGPAYYTFSDLNSLSDVLLQAIENPKKYLLSSQLKNTILEKGWIFQTKRWVSFLKSIQV